MKPLHTPTFLLALYTFLGGTVARATPTYTMQILGNYDDATATTYTSINDAGQMIGTAFFETPLPYPLPSPISTTTFRTEPYASVIPGQDDILPPANATDNALAPVGINNLGQVVGIDHDNIYIYVTSPDGSRQAVLAAPQRNGVQGINDRGQIVSYDTVYTPDGAGGYIARRIDPTGQYVSQGAAINDTGQVAGKFSLPGFLFRTGPNQPLNPATDLFSFGQAPGVTAINASGTVVGYGDVPDPAASTEVPATKLDSFFYDGTVHDLGSLGGSSTVAWSINNASQIVGSSGLPDDSIHGFLYQNGQMYDLNDLTTSLGGWTIINANDINNEGIILAQAELPGQFLPTNILLLPNAGTGVPEPATAPLVAIGVLALRRRVRRAF